MHVDVAPQRVTTVAGLASELLVTVTNTSDLIGGYSLRALGVDPDWATFDEPEPRLFPGESTTVRLSLQLPDRSPAGDRPVAIQVTDLQDPSRVVVTEAVLEVPPAPYATIDLDPPTVTSGKTGAFTATVHNEGNTIQLLQLAGVDPEALTTFTFEPAEIRLAPGASTAVALTVQGKRPLVGDPALRPFTVTANGPQISPEAQPPTAAGMFVQKPLFSRGLLGLLGLVAAITVFATVITLALTSVVQRSAADRDLALQVAQARQATATTGRSGLGGSVIELSTGAPAPGVAVELFTADETSTPVATTATDDAGTFTLSRLPAGDFLLRVRGAGFAEVWYPSAAAPNDATPVTLSEGQTVDDLVVMVGGVPATVSGTVVGDDVGGATVRVEMPLDAEPLQGQVDPVPGEAASAAGAGGGGALVRLVPISDNGEFEITDLPSPAIYDLVVVKPGFATSTQRLDLAAGETRDGIELPLLVGDGSISGTVNGTEGPLGGAAVVATAGQTRVETVSLTEDDVGSFVLRGLPTPGSYTVVVSADGYTSATLQLTLPAGQELTGVSVVLGRDKTTLAGTVTVSGGDASGVTVTVSDGATTLQTVTQSVAPLGTWQLSGVAVPGDYTVTFARPDLESRVLSVSVDPFGNVTSGAGSGSIDVTMRSATAILTGLVSQTHGDGDVQPVGNVVVTVSSGTTDWIVTTASTPTSDVGRYRVEDLPPGTYTVSFARTGTRTTSQIVQLSAAQTRTLSPVLVAPARISGTISGGSPLGGRLVWLYRAADYGTSAAPVAQVGTADDGGYVIEDVEAPQNYVIEVRTSSGTVIGASAPFTLEASEDRTVDIEIDEGS